MSISAEVDFRCETFGRTMSETAQQDVTQSPPIVFVRGTGRCGSKTLANQLGLHPAISKVSANQCLPEDLIDWSEDYLRPRCPKLTDAAVASACKAYFEACCKSLRDKPGIMLHKSTANVHRLATLLDYWPDAKIIYIVRHPLGVVPAYISVDIIHYKGGYGYDATVANSLLRWANDVLAYLRSPAFSHPRVLQVRFEDMINDTDRFFARIYRFLGVDDTIRHVLPGPVEYDDEFILNGQERQWIINSTADIVHRLGYDPDEYVVQLSDEHTGDGAAHPDRRLTTKPPALDGVELVRRALAEAVKQGWMRVGLFGAGYLSRLICPHLDDMPAQIVCLLDENPSLVGASIAGLPIHHPRQASSLGIDAVIPVTLTHQDTMISRWHCLYEDYIPILELWPYQTIQHVGL